MQSLVTTFRPGPVARISFGLVALIISLLLLADFILGVLPDQANAQRQQRQHTVESLALQISALLESADDRILNQTLRQVANHDTTIQSIGIRGMDRTLVAEVGDHAQLWRKAITDGEADNHITLPLFANREHWGDIELNFKAAEQRSLVSWLTQPHIQLLAMIIVGGGLLYYVYLRRAMQYLDPSSAVPDRVRKTLDFLVEGVVILDRQGRIVLANQAFRDLHPAIDRSLNGQLIAELGWLKGENSEIQAPWFRSLYSKAVISGEVLNIQLENESPTKAIVSCTPILGSNDRVCGCLITFDDVTEIERKNTELALAYEEIARAQEKLKAKNEELHFLASRDPLTGCFNRRAFFESAEEMFTQAARLHNNFCCLMTDIDHFKGFNDVYGHQIGDQVIQVVVRTLNRHLRVNDLLCRYGGEEFCIILPNTSHEEAFAVAERMRKDIEENSSAAIRSAQVRTITSSFGVASLRHGALNLAELIERADEALYTSKENGRNRVSFWQSPEG